MSVRLIIVCGVLALVGCKKQAAAPENAAVPPPAAGVVPTEASSVAVTPGNASGAATDEAQLTAALAEMTQAVRRFGVEQQRVPKTLDEVVAAGYLARIPAAPAGKKFAIDKKLQVYLAKP